MFYSSSKHKNIVQFSTSAWIVRAKTKRPNRKSRGVCNANMWACTCKPLCEWVFFFFLVARHWSQSTRILAGSFGWHSVFRPPPSITQRIRVFLFFFSTVRDWHRAEMQNNNPLITWVLPVLGFICNGCESPQCLVITAFDLGNNVFTVALLRARRQCSSNPQCILVESHYTKTTRVLLQRGGVVAMGGLKEEVAMETSFSLSLSLSLRHKCTYT